MRTRRSGCEEGTDDERRLHACGLHTCSGEKVNLAQVRKWLHIGVILSKTLQYREFSFSKQRRLRERADARVCVRLQFEKKN